MEQDLTLKINSNNRNNNMKAIQTKYLGPTNTKPSRIKCSAEGVRSIIYSKSELEDALETSGVSSLNQDNVHKLAARKFALACGWPVNLASGGLPDGSWAHCFVVSPVEAPVSPKPKLFTVVTVSANTNSFGYKSVLCLAEDGDGVAFLVQAYGTDKVPVRGDVVHKGESRWFGAPRTLSRISAERAKKILAEVEVGK